MTHQTTAILKVTQSPDPTIRQNMGLPVVEVVVVVVDIEQGPVIVVAVAVAASAFPIHTIQASGSLPDLEGFVVRQGNHRHSARNVPK